jgi:FlaA1/EpsC-like NDP-sugar epimerase
MKHIPRWIKIPLYMTADFLGILSLGLFILFSRNLSVDFQSLLLSAVFFYAIFLILILFISGIYHMITLHFGLVDSLKLGIISILVNIIFFISLRMLRIPFSPIEFAFVMVSEPAILIGLRVARRVLAIVLGYSKVDITTFQRTLVIGAGAAGKLIIDELRTNQQLQAIPVVVVDDDKEKWRRKFLNLPVEGPVANVAHVIQQYQVQQVIIAVGNISRERLFEILRFMDKVSVKIRRLPLMEELEKDGHAMKVKDVDVTELLGRDVVPLMNDDIKNSIKNQVVLITGAGGSIGSELTRQIFSYQPKQLILLDIYENGVYDVQQELVKLNKKLSQPIPVHVVIGSTYNFERMALLFKTYQPNLVYHAAAYKHVPLMEDSPQEAIRTNILGTYHIASLSHQFQVKKMVLVSTDKAVRSTNVMGATKYYAETIVRHFAKLSQTTAYGAVRFGNVLASNGSVIPLFKKQIEAGGPVTVTDKNITRFFMTIPEAVGLILQCGVYAKDGEIFVLDMGKPVKVLELAEKMIRQSGYLPYKEIAIEFTGLRPGEKMYEELLLDPTTNLKTPNEKIFIDRTEHLAFNQQAFDDIVNKALQNDPQVHDLLFKQLKLKE